MTGTLRGTVSTTSIKRARGLAICPIRIHSVPEAEDSNPNSPYAVINPASSESHRHGKNCDWHAVA